VYKFKNDVYSTKIKENIGETFSQYMSYQQISRNIIRIYRNYTYNNTINLLNDVNNKNQQTQFINADTTKSMKEFFLSFFLSFSEQKN
jgi:hypothetical protein